MMLGVGSVASNCGPNPCGFMDVFSPSAECDTWQSCAAVENSGAGSGGSPVSSGCVDGGLDANGNTIVSCGGGTPDCLMGSGPLQAGQVYCAGVLDAAQMASAQYFEQQAAGAPSLMSGSVIAIGLGLLAVVLLAGRR